MGEVEVVDGFGPLVRELVAEGEADAPGVAVGPDEIETDDFRLLATGQREGR